MIASGQPFFTDISNGVVYTLHGDHFVHGSDHRGNVITCNILLTNLKGTATFL